MSERTLLADPDTSNKTLRKISFKRNKEQRNKERNKEHNDNVRECRGYLATTPLSRLVTEGGAATRASMSSKRPKNATWEAKAEPLPAPEGDAVQFFLESDLTDVKAW